MRLSIADYFRKCIIEQSIQAEAPAVVDEDGQTVSLTFASLDSLSTKLAKALRLLKDWYIESAFHKTLITHNLTYFI